MTWVQARLREWTTWVGLAILAVILVARIRPELGIWDAIVAPIGFCLTLLSDERRFKMLEGIVNLIARFHTTTTEPPTPGVPYMTDISTSFYATLLAAVPPTAVRDLLTGNPSAAANEIIGALPAAAAQLPAPYGTIVQDVITEIKAPGFDNTTKVILDLVAAFSSIHAELTTLRALNVPSTAPQPAA